MMLGCRTGAEDRPQCLSTLLSSRFFGSCRAHRTLRKNEENAFCIDCSIKFCKHCTVDHRCHDWLQIWKYVYRDVVRVQDIEKHLDCSKIQTYKVNGEKAVHLNPRPKTKCTRQSTKSNIGSSCQTCGRFLQDVPNCFCSIACKVAANSNIANQPENKLPSRQILEHDNNNEGSSLERNMSQKEPSIPSAESSKETQAQPRLSAALQPRKQLRRRKGIPHRSPLF